MKELMRPSYDGSVLWRSTSLFIAAKVGKFDVLVILTVLHDSKSWLANVMVRRSVKGINKKCFLKSPGVNFKDLR